MPGAPNNVPKELPLRIQAACQQDLLQRQEACRQRIWPLRFLVRNRFGARQWMWRRQEQDVLGKRKELANESVRMGMDKHFKMAAEMEE